MPKFAGLSGHSSAALACALLSFTLLLPGWASDARAADALNTIFSFASSGSEGNLPNGVIQGSDGYLYGTTSGAGQNNDGTAFKLSTSGTLEFVASFSAYSTGSSPESALIEGSDGNFYGTASDGGANGTGTIFKLTPDGALSAVQSFNASDNGNKSSLVEDRQGNFYGTSAQGGAASRGAVFQVTPSGTENILYSFLDNGSDGANPNGVLLGSDGNFYGTTTGGGANGNGTIFQVTPSGQETILYNFTAYDSNQVNSDGAEPAAGLIQDSQGNFYGTTQFGGANGVGTIYKYSLTHGFSVLYTGSAGLGFNGAVSGLLAPLPALTLGTGGNLYGTTFAGGNGSGTIFGITTAGALSVLHNFGGANEGSQPNSALIQGSDGNFYGTTQSNFGRGTVFQFNTTPVVTLASPPGDVTVVSGTTLPLTASVADPAGLLTQVQFYLGSTLLGASAAPGPYTASATAPAPGSYTLEAVATDSLGRQSTSSVALTVVAATSSAPAPNITQLTAGNGLTLAANSTLTLDVAVNAGSASDPLESVSFYANGVLFASFDGSGNPITSQSGQIGGGLVRKDAATGDSVFEAQYQFGNVSGQFNLIAVAVDKLGISQIAAPLTVQSAPASAGQAPVVSIGVTDGSAAPVNSALAVPVTVTDPIARPIAKVAYYVNSAEVNGSAQPPYGFTFTPTAAGEYILSAAATDGSGLSAVSVVHVQAAAMVPKVSIAVKGDGTINENGGKGKFVIQLVGGTALPADLKVKYEIEGTAINGADYTRIRKSAVIPAGAAKAKVVILPIDEGIAGGATRSVTIKLLASPSGVYQLGAPKKATIQILDNGLGEPIRQGFGRNFSNSVRAMPTTWSML